MAGTSVPTIFILVIATAHACLITNCPRGGKRSGDRLPTEGDAEKPPFCTPCGHPARRGVCFGPTMCCSPFGGCEVGGPHATACMNIQAVPPACRMPSLAPPVESESALRCGAGRGYCKPNGLCCTSDWCRVDERCIAAALEPSSSADLVVSDRALETSLRRGSEEPNSFNDWHSNDEAERNAPHAFQI